MQPRETSTAVLNLYAPDPARPLTGAGEGFLYQFKGGGAAAAGRRGTAKPTGCGACGRGARAGLAGGGWRPRPRPARDLPSGRPPANALAIVGVCRLAELSHHTPVVRIWSAESPREHA